MLPLTQEQLNKLQDVTKDLTPAQFAWLSGYFWGQFNQHSSTKDELVSVQSQVPQQETITVISASQTGNARRLAEQLRDKLVGNQLNVELYSASEYKFKQIHKTTTLIIITSTQGKVNLLKKPSHFINICTLKSRANEANGLCCTESRR